MRSSDLAVDEFLALEEEGRRIGAAARAGPRGAPLPCRRPPLRRRLVHRRPPAHHRPGRQGRAAPEPRDRGPLRLGWPSACAAAHVKGEFCLKGPNPDATGSRSTKLRKTLDQLNKAWRALPAAEPSGDQAVTVHLPKLADSGFDRFLSAAVEAFEEP